MGLSGKAAAQRVAEAARDFDLILEPEVVGQVQSELRARYYPRVLAPATLPSICRAECYCSSVACWERYDIWGTGCSWHQVASCGASQAKELKAVTLGR